MDSSAVDAAIRELTSLLDRDADREQEFQDWFERHPVTLTVLGFAKWLAQQRIRAENGEVFIPDFLARRHNGRWEIVELKTPQAKVLLDRERRQAFYAAFQSYVAQCQEYSEALDVRSVRDEFAERTGINLQPRPRTLLIAGRSAMLEREKVAVLCNRLVPPVEHLTYDDLLAALHQYRVVHFGDSSVGGVTVSAVIGFVKPPQPYLNSHLIDVGVHAKRDRIALFVNPAGVIGVDVYDSFGDVHRVRGSRALREDEYLRPHHLIFQVGTVASSAFISVELDGEVIADARVQSLPFVLSDAMALGTDFTGSAKSWFRLWQLIVTQGTLTPEMRHALRQAAQEHILPFLLGKGSDWLEGDGDAAMVSTTHPLHVGSSGSDLPGGPRIVGEIRQDVPPGTQQAIPQRPYRSPE
jgi:hypothetical protein